MHFYRVIGGDQREYGPATPDQVRQWVAVGRVNAQSLVKAEGTDAWVPLGSVPELAGSALPPLVPVSLEVPRGGAFGRRPAADQIKGPAIFLIVIGVLTAFNSLAGLGFSAFHAANPLWRDLWTRELPAELRWISPWAITVPTDVLGLLSGALIVAGGLSMLRLTNYSLAVVAAILALIPCGCCCGLGLVAGIWALTILMRPEVKAAFH